LGRGAILRWDCPLGGVRFVKGTEDEEFVHGRNKSLRGESKNEACLQILKVLSGINWGKSDTKSSLCCLGEKNIDSPRRSGGKKEEENRKRVEDLI